jgi:hypothetical protein
VYGGIADNDDLGRGQVQGMVGGQYNVRSGLALTFGFLAGKYEASPRIGGPLNRFSGLFPPCRQALADTSALSPGFFDSRLYSPHPLWNASLKYLGLVQHCLIRRSA